VVSIAGLLLTLGLVMVYSSSIAIAEGGRFTGYQPAYYLIRHGVFLFVGLMAGFVCFQFRCDSGNRPHRICSAPAWCC